MFINIEITIMKQIESLEGISEVRKQKIIEDFEANFTNIPTDIHPAILLQILLPVNSYLTTMALVGLGLDSVYIYEAGISLLDEQVKKLGEEPLASNNLELQKLLTSISTLFVWHALGEGNPSELSLNKYEKYINHDSGKSIIPSFLNVIKQCESMIEENELDSERIGYALTATIKMKNVELVEYMIANYINDINEEAQIYSFVKAIEVSSIPLLEKLSKSFPEVDFINALCSMQENDVVFSFASSSNIDCIKYLLDANKGKIMLHSLVDVFKQMLENDADSAKVELIENAIIFEMNKKFFQHSDEDRYKAQNVDDKYGELRDFFYNSVLYNRKFATTLLTKYEIPEHTRQNVLYDLIGKMDGSELFYEILISVNQFNIDGRQRISLLDEDKDRSIQLFLMKAIRSSDLIGVKLLIKYGANVNIIEERTGDTPLMVAMQSGNRDSQIEIINILLNSGADVNDRHRKTGLTILMSAVQQRQTAVVEALLSKKPNIDEACIIDNESITALQLAYRTLNVEVMELLIRNG